MNTNHTPTPWQWSDDPATTYQTDLIGQNNQVVGCMTWTSPGMDGQLATVNARLIVQAVNSHAALVAALKDLLEWSYDTSQPCEARRQSARAALALANT